jgi:hypothetical protein
MLAAALALLVIGLVLGLFLGVFGFIVAAVGVVLLILALLGVGRRAVETGP